MMRPARTSRLGRVVDVGSRMPGVALLVTVLAFNVTARARSRTAGRGAVGARAAARASRDLSITLGTRRGAVAGVEQRRPPARAGREARARRRERRRQDVVARPIDGLYRRPAIRRAAAVRRPRLARDGRGRQAAGIRGKGVGMIFQAPKASLNPLAEGGRPDRATRRATRRPRERRRTPLELIAPSGSRTRRRGRRLPARAVGRDGAARDDRDRARLLAGLLIADEPTTGLDVTIQTQIFELLRDAAGAPEGWRSC